MVNGANNAFWQALVFTIVVFAGGVFLGAIIEQSRANHFEMEVLNSQINFEDQKLRIALSQNSNLSCDEWIDGIFNFADRVYEEAQTLERYDSSSSLSDNLKVIHRQYDLLRLNLISESNLLVDKCVDSDFHTVVYFFDYGSEDIEIRSLQTSFARVLTQLKADNPDKVLLLPIAGNLELESVNLALKNHNINRLPAIVIDDKYVVNDLKSSSELEKYLL
jgi:hypothetical protein